MAKESSHGHFLLLMRVSGVSAGKIDELAKAIHDAYMAAYGQVGAITVALHKLLSVVDQGTNVKATAQWQYAIRYFGPTASVGKLQEMLESAAKDAGGEVQTQTYKVTDLTGKY